MKIPPRLKLRMAAAQQDLKRASERLSKRSGPPRLGDLYVFPLDVDIAVEWLVVREHPDNHGLLFLVPVDDFPPAGVPDVTLPQNRLDRPLTARCGEGLWAEADLLDADERVDAVPPDVLGLVRSGVARLARGELTGTDEQRSVEADPAYEGWLASVEEAGEQLEAYLQRKKNRPIPVPRPKDGLELDVARWKRWSARVARERPAPLAAAPGDEFLTELADELARAAVELHYYEFSKDAAGKLIFLANERGVRAAWHGDLSEAPQVRSKGSSGRLRKTDWKSDPQGALHRTEPIFPWVDGHVVLSIGGKKKSQTVIIRQRKP
jgi:hypothetical protein